MIMPSMVRAVRILLRLRALSAMRRIMKIDMMLSSARCLRRLEIHEFLPGDPAMADRTIRDHLSVAECHDAGAVLRDVRLVCDEQHRDAAVPVEPLEDSHHLDAGLRVEVSSR